MSSRPNTPYRPCLCSIDVSKTDTERQAPYTRHQALYIPDTCFVCVTIRRRHLDLTISWCEDSGCFPPEMFETAAWNPTVRPSPKWWSTTTDRSDFTAPSPIPSTHLGFWACGSAWRRHTGKYGSSAPHQRIIQPISWPHQHPTTLFLQAGCPSCRPTNSVKALLWIRCTILLGLQIVSTVDKILTDIARRGCRVSCYRTQTCDKQRDRHTTQPYLES